MHPHFLAAIPLTVTCLIATAQVPIAPFTQQTWSFPANVAEVVPAPMPPADWDGDGDPDLLVTGQRTLDSGLNVPFMALAFNDGHAHFTLGPDLPPFGTGIADFDNDGDIDAFEGGYFARNRGDGTFQFEKVPFPVGPVFAGDFDGDGDADIAVRWNPRSNSDTSVSIFLNQKGTFVPIEPATPTAGQGLFHVADWDADGDLDLLTGTHGDVNRFETAFAQIQFNRGDGVFEGPVAQLFGVAPIGQGDSWIVDDDHDGDLDVITWKYGFGITNDVFVRLTNLGQGNFAPTNVPPRNNKISADYDHDGDLDWVESVYLPALGTTRWFLVRNDGEGSASRQSPAFRQPPQLADLDGDGDLDFIGINEITNIALNTVTVAPILLSHSETANQSPTVPSDLTAQAEPGDRVRFAWAPSRDDHTPLAKVTYRLRVGTTPGGTEIVSPGQLIASDTGTWTTAFRTLHHLPPGTYHWSVQAMDGQFIASAWAPEQTWILDKPAMSPIASQTTVPDLPSRPIPFTVTGDSTTPAAALTLTFESEHPELLPESGMTVLGAGTERGLILTPSALSGTTHVTMTATSATGLSAKVRFRVTVARFGLETFTFGELPFGGWSTADLDQDGDLDLLGGASWIGGNREKLLLRNPGDAGFLPAPEPFTEGFLGVFVPGDIDGDGQAEVLGIPKPGGSFLREEDSPQLWRVDPNLRFTPAPYAITNAVTLPEIANGDRDPVLDLLLWGSGQDSSERHEWLTHLAVTSKWLPPGLPGPPNLGMGWGDFDADGDLDVVVSGWQRAPESLTDLKFTRLYLNEYPNGFQPSDAGLPQDDLYRVYPFDFDQDGLLDLFLGPLALVYRPPDFAGSPARLFRNTGQGSFTEVITTFPALLSAMPAWGDFDQDGDPDLLLVSDVHGPGFSPQLWRHDGPAGFTRIETGFVLPQANEAFWGDFDNDGDLDAVLAGLDGYPKFGLFLARNASARSNTPPNSPTHLTVLRTSAGALLSWNEAVDPDQSTRLTYNLRVGRSPGAGDVIAPLADPITGRRRTTGPGNVGPLLKRQLGDLPDGTYYWSVQAVDAGYAASPFAPEQTFVVSRPTLSGLSNLFIPANQASGPFPFAIADAETSADQLRITFTSSNTALLPVTGITATGTGNTRNLLLNPNPYRAGTTTIRASVEDANGEQRSLTFSVTVRGELSPIATPLSDFFNGKAAWGDADLDGDLDLLLGGWNSEPVFGSSNDSSIFENRNGQLGVHRLATLSPAVTEYLEWIDINRDGILDVFATILHGSQRSTYLFEGKTNASWTLVNPQFGPLPTYIRSASAWADADNDGDLDLLQFGSLTETKAGAQLQLSQGRFGFSPSRDHQPFPMHDAAVAWADIDGDGDNDYVVAGRPTPSSPASVTLLYRNHQGRFTDSPVSLPGITQGSATFSDVDADGDPDLLLTGAGTDGPLTRLFRNDGAGNFSEMPTDLPQLRDSAAAWADADGDGRPDLALCGLRSGTTEAGDPVTGVWLNRTHGFVPAAMVAPGVFAGSLAWGDFDGDGAPDLVITGITNTSPTSGRFTGVFRNEFNRPTPTPPAPVNLSSRIEGDDSIFQWSLPPGSPSGLSFNLRVGTAPGLDDVVRVAADPVTGTLRIPQHGNTGWSGSWRLRGLPVQAYSWSVQSVDAAYRGSAFSSDSILGVPNAPPIVGTIPSQDGPVNAPIGPISFSVADPDGDAAAITLSATSSHPTLIATNQITFSGSDASRQITLVPQPNTHGSTAITLTVRDAQGATAQTSFNVNVSLLTRVPLLTLDFEPVSLAPADYDHDGDPDLLYGYFRQGDTSGGQTLSGLHMNDGAFLFTSNIVMSLPARDPRPSWGDVDGDGDLDLFTASTLMRNDRGSFVAEAIDVDPDAPSAWGDYDGDGDLDLAVVGGSKRLALLFRNDGGQLTRTSVSWRPVADGAAAWGDPDQDGDLDLAISGRESDNLGALPRLVVYRNDAGQFVEVVRELGVSKGFLQWADINRDGRPDLLMAGQTPDGPRERIAWNLSGLRFYWTQFTISPGSFSGYPGAALVDLDNDGDLDLAEFTANASFAIRANDGNGNFATNAMASANVPAGLLRFADFDRDGDFDVVVAGRRSNVAPGNGTTFLFRNHHATTAPTSSRLESTITGNDVELRWPGSPSFGPPGSANTFNLRVGTSPGAFDVVTPLIDLKSGHRLVADHGNMGFSQRTRLRGLPPGTYYWSVQPVDSAWIGGPFEAESTFTITQALAPTRFERWSTPSAETLELTLGAPPGFLVIVESALQLQPTNWIHQSVRRFGPSGTETWVVPRLREAEYFRLRAIP